MKKTDLTLIIDFNGNERIRIYEVYMNCPAAFITITSLSAVKSRPQRAEKDAQELGGEAEWNHACHGDGDSNDNRINEIGAVLKNQKINGKVLFFP